MNKAPLPSDEVIRQADLESYDILDTPADADFDGIVELASQICKCPVSLITLLDKDRQWFKSRKGFSDESTSRDEAFCSHTIMQDHVFVVEDATKDPRFADNPLVTGEHGVRFYAGAPIISPAGYKLGAVCIIDKEARTLSAEEERALILLSAQVTKLLEIRKKNALIRSRAREIITLKSRAINRMMEAYEKDKKEIAEDIHEDFAQSIASSMMYLNMAEMDETLRLEHLLTAREQLNDTLINMRQLSYRITPVALNFLNANDTLIEFVERTATTYPFNVEVEESDKQEAVRVDNTLVAVRVLEHWLKSLSEDKNITEVKIAIRVEEQIKLTIVDDSYLPLADERRGYLFDSVIHDKIEAYGGEAELRIKPGNNLLSITLPVGEAMTMTTHLMNIAV